MICLTSFFVFNTVLCLLVCSLSVFLSTEEASLTVLVFLMLYIFAYLFFSVKRPLCIQYMSPASGAFDPRPPPGLCPWTPLGIFRPSDPLFCPPSKFLASPLCCIIQSTCQHAHAAVNWLSMSLSRHTCQMSLACINQINQIYS